MKNYSGKQLVKARLKAGYQTRDNFYQSLTVYLEKQKRENELPHYKTIQRMENENKFSKKSIKLICEFLGIPEEDLIETNSIEESKLKKKEIDEPFIHHSISRPFLIENSKQIKKIISDTNKRIIVCDYNQENLSIYQDKAISQLFYIIDNFAENKTNAFDIVKKHNFGSENAYHFKNELSKSNEIDYCLKNLSTGCSWVPVSDIPQALLHDDDNLEYYSNSNLDHPDNKKLNPLFLHGISYDYYTYWPYPNHLYDKFMSSETESKPYLEDIYFPKKEEVFTHSEDAPDKLNTFDPNQPNIYRLAPVLLKYSILILSSSNNIDLLAINNKLQKKVEKEVGDIIYGVPEHQDGDFYLFGREYNGTYKEVLSKISNDQDIPKNYLDPEDFKFIYGKSKSIAESYAKFVESETGQKVKVAISDDEEVTNQTFEEAKKNKKNEIYE